jgi:hypothetical protein
MGRSFAFLLAFLATASALATERIEVDPYVKAGPGYTAANGSLTGYVPSKSNQQLLLEAERKGWLGSSATKTPVTVKPKVTVPIGGVAGKVKGLLKTSPGQVAMSAAISAAIAGVGWVMSDDNTTIQKKVSTIPDAVAGTYYAVTYSPTGKMYYGLTKSTACGAVPGGSIPAGEVNCFYKISNGSTVAIPIYKYSCASSVWFNPNTGLCDPAFSPTQLVPIADSDYQMLDPWLNQQSADWLKGLLKETCEGSLNPQACFDDLQKQSKAIISGPTSVQGPKQTTTGTYNRPDGTLGSTATTTDTTYNIRYGDTYFDYDTVTTKTTTQDGVQTGQETTSDQGDPQEKPKDEQEEKPKREAVAGDCDAPLSCSGDAIDCAVLGQEKALRCAYEKQSDYDKHKDEIKAAVTGQKFEIDDSSEIQIPSFINQGTRFLPAACPADKTFSLQSGAGRSFALTYEPLCAAATDLGYLIVIAVGAFCVLYVGRSLGGE